MSLVPALPAEAEDWRVSVTQVEERLLTPDQWPVMPLAEIVRGRGSDKPIRAALDGRLGTGAAKRHCELGYFPTSTIADNFAIAHRLNPLNVWGDRWWQMATWAQGRDVERLFELQRGSLSSWLKTASRYEGRSLYSTMPTPALIRGRRWWHVPDLEQWLEATAAQRADYVSTRAARRCA